MSSKAEMMKKVFLLILIALPCFQKDAVGSSCSEASCEGYISNSNSNYFRDDDYDGNPDPYSQGCLQDPWGDKTLTTRCYQDPYGYDKVKIYSCEYGCQNGYEMVPYGYNIGSCGIPFNTCVYQCINNCYIGSTESCYMGSGAAGTRTITGGNSCTGGCTYSACKVSYCYNGWYKKSDTVCANCSVDTGVMNSTSNWGNSSGISDCYIPTGAEFDDNTGDGDFASNCYHD